MYKLRYPFDGKIVPEIKKHLESKWPEEAGGIVVNDTYVPCENTSESRTDTFSIDTEVYMECEEKGEIQAIIHSHDDWPHASEADMVSQIATDVPWGIMSIKNGRFDTAFFWGDCLEPVDFIGRSFHHGVHDCYALVRDYYRVEKGIMLKTILREYGWWKTDPPQDLLKDNISNYGFVVVDEKDMQPGDVLLFRIKYKVVNHSAVYLGRGLILHQFCAPGVISRTEPLNRWKKMLTHCLRYIGEDNV